MQVWVCDRCGAEVSADSREFAEWGIVSIAQTMQTMRHYHLCGACYWPVVEPITVMRHSAVDFVLGELEKGLNDKA